MLTSAVASLLALLAAIVLSCTSQLNVSLLAMALAWIIGVFVAGWPADAVAGGFPTQLFLTLAGVTLLFSVSEVNGTLDALDCARAVPGPRRPITGVPFTCRAAGERRPL